MGRVMCIVIAIFLLLGAFVVPINDGIKGWRADDVTEAFAVTTAAGVTTANVTLSRELYQDEPSEVISISSNVTGETPVATLYTSATQVLLVSALNPSETHTLAVNFYAETESSVIKVVGPFLSLLIIGGLIVLIFMGARKR